MTMAARKTNPDFLNGVPELLLLKLLSRQPMYGYQLVQAIRAAGEDLQFGEGCIYPILHRLEADQFLTSRRETVAGRSRVIYEVTERGRRRLAESADTWERIVRAVGQVLRGGENYEPRMV
jgi:PadR family transcriptional regulator, regulatory protein PadR